ncbi:unnamed protein product [Leptidea sinapis]|uniref:FAD-binding PCMH-type domain-containing protein n=1 Tax=Leptidea sinapis TaxID=189913 RepID=A0A5E4QAF0_9NEOP|nr:unnamed protein product [Leptidea sinapis]
MVTGEDRNEDTVVNIDGKYSPDMSLNEYIRTVADLRGTKVMCQEGGCGICIVSVKAAAPPTYEQRIFSVNSCLVSIFSCHGWEVTTIEGIGSRNKGYHEIQQRLANFNGSQCGFCSPGWVMSMYSIYESKSKNMSKTEIENSFASNICRCTGYRAIADAFKSFANDVQEGKQNDIIDLEDLGKVTCRTRCPKKTESVNKDAPSCYNDWCFLENMQNEKVEIDCNGYKWYRAQSLEYLFKAMNNGEFRLIAGNTGQGVYHVIEYPPNLIDISNVIELKGYEHEVNLVLGAGMTLLEMSDLFYKVSKNNEDFSYLQQFWEHIDLVAHIPVKNIGTIGGNLFIKYAHPEFQSDLFLLFESVNAMVTIGEGVGKNKIMSLLDFMKCDMNDFTHAFKTEKLLTGKDPFTDEILQMALTSLSEEIIPENSETEPSAEFRKKLALNLFYKAILSLCPDEKINPYFRSGGKVFKRGTSKGSQHYDTDKSVWPLNQPVPKLEAIAQCSGEAMYANALPKQINEVFASFVTANAVPGSIISGFDASEALKLPGVLAFYSSKDIPGSNTFTPKGIPLLVDEEEIFCSGKVLFYGQPAGLIVAEREKMAHKAAKLVKIQYSSVNKTKPILTIDDALKSSDKNRIISSTMIEPTEIGNDVKCVVSGEFRIWDQYHFYMEPQTCIAIPTEDGMEVYASTQWLDLTNVAVAHCLNIPVNSVNVIVLKLGGSYGGKITRASQIACAAALVTHLQRKPCRLVLPLQTNMQSIGKRLPTQNAYEVGVDNKGVIQYLKNEYYQDNGHSTNEAIAPLTVDHFFNCYDTTRWKIKAYTVLTDKPSNTWCRSPGSTEGVAMIEVIMEKIAFETKRDALDVRIANMTKEDNPIPEMIKQVQKDCDYEMRVKFIQKYNDQNRWRKRVLKIIPMKYPIWYFGNYNSIVSIYHDDGSVVITHGGIEMGQGLNTKVAQVCAHTLGIPLEKVSVKSSRSFTSPNTMATGASIGSECVSYATKKACDILLERLAPFRGNGDFTWEELVKEAFKADVYLQASYMYAASKEEFKPYAVYAVCVFELDLDILTGTHNIVRVDLIEDTGRSLSPLIDVTQIEGAFIMGIGYWTSENLIYDSTTGRLLTDRTWTYKPPGIKDIPEDMRIYFRKNAPNEMISSESPRAVSL